MTATLEFFFDFGSPATYLAFTQIEGLAQRANADLVWRPFLLGGVFQATGNASPAMIPAKGAYMIADLARFAKRYGVPFTMNPHFPINTLTLMRGAVVAEEEGYLRNYTGACFDAMWVEPQNLNDPEVTKHMLDHAGLDGGHILTRTQEPAIKDKLKLSTGEAVERGAFGAPTFFVNKTEMFFGQDRLDLVEEALRGA